MQTVISSIDVDKIVTNISSEVININSIPTFFNQDTNFYVNPDTGDDTNSGTSEGQPFKTLTRALNYIAEHYNLANFNCVINLASGTYSDDSAEATVLSLPNFNSISSKVIIQGTDRDSTILNYMIELTHNAQFVFKNLTIAPTITTESTYENRYSIIYVSNQGTLNLYNCNVDISSVNSGYYFYNYVFNQDHGYINITKDDETEYGLTINFGTTYPENYWYVFYVYMNSILNISANIVVKGTNIMANSRFVRANYGSIVRAYNENFSGAPSITLDDDAEFDGIRYNSMAYSNISVPSQNTEFFPGSSEGTTSDGLYTSTGS